MGQVFAERFQESESWLGKAKHSLLGDRCSLTVCWGVRWYFAYLTRWFISLIAHMGRTYIWCTSLTAVHLTNSLSLHFFTLKKKWGRVPSISCWFLLIMLRIRKGPRQDGISKIPCCKLGRNRRSTGSSSMVLGWHRNVSSSLAKKGIADHRYVLLILLGGLKWHIFCIAVTAATPCWQMMFLVLTFCVHILKNTAVVLSSSVFPLVWSPTS